MGQQQLLLIVLGVILVGIAAYGGLRLTQSYNESHERDLILQQMTVLLGEAKKYALRPKSLGGGEGSFQGFVPMGKLTRTDRVTIYATAGDTWVLFQGFGIVTGWDGKTPVQVVAQGDLSKDQLQSVTLVN